MRQMHSVAAILVATAFLAGGRCGPAHADILEGARLDQHLYGPQITSDSLKGKVVFVEYWGINCSPCRASFPHLVRLQKKLAPTGKFTVFASHVQNQTDQVRSFLEARKVNFPVYQQARLLKAPCASGVPSAHLFDHTGTLVASGRPSQLYQEAEKLVNAAPHPLLGGVTPKYCKSEAQAIIGGRPLASVVRSLKQKIKREGLIGEEASQLLSVVKQRLFRQLTNAKELLEKRPTAAAPALKGLSAKARGLPEGKEAGELLSALVRDPGYQSLAKIRVTFDRLGNKPNTSRNARTTAMKKALQQIMDAGKSQPGVIAEAGGLLAELE